jgi:hypothetical protein
LERELTPSPIERRSKMFQEAKMSQNGLESRMKTDARRPAVSSPGVAQLQIDGSKSHDCSSPAHTSDCELISGLNGHTQGIDEQLRQEDIVHPCIDQGL